MEPGSTQSKTTEQIEEEAEKIATRDTLALVGFVLSLVGFLSGLNLFVAWPMDVVGIALSVMGRKSKHWSTFAKAGVIIGIVGFIGAILIFKFSLVFQLEFIKGYIDAAG